MDFKAFVKMLMAEYKKHGALVSKKTDNSSEVPQRPLTFGELGGMSCQVCLSADGKISAEQTAIIISFRIGG